MTTSNGKVALVTGATRGIGRAIAVALGERGWTVLVGARDPAAGAAVARGIPGAEAIALDVTDPASVRSAADTVAARHERLDALVNNAGVATEIVAPHDEDPDAMRAVYETNVFGVVRVTNALLPLLRKAPAARIVNVTSKRGSIAEPGAWAGTPSMAYSTSKTALNAVTVHYARDLAGTSIKVNGAAPGFVATDFNGFRGTRTPAEGAAVAVRLAELDADGPNGEVFEDDVRLAW